MAYDLGDTARLAVDVRDAANVLVNPVSIALTITLPDGTTANPSVANPPAVTGRFFADYAPSQAGRHGVRWTSTSPTTAFSDIFDVRPAAPAYIVSLADAKGQVQIPPTVTTHDEELRGWVEAATEVVERHSNRVVTRRAVVETQLLSLVNRVALLYRPVISLTSIAQLNGAATWMVGGMDVDESGILTVLTGPALSGLVRFTYVAGYLIPPAHLTKAALIIIQHLWDSQRGEVGAPRFGGLSGTMIQVQGVAYAIPNRAIELMGSPVPMVG